VCRQRSFEGGFRGQWPYLRQSQAVGCAAQVRRDDGPSQGTQLDARQRAALGLEAKVCTHHRQQARHVSVSQCAAAHGLLAGPLNKGMRVYGSGPTALNCYALVGASPDAANRFTLDLMNTIKGSYP